MARSNYIVRGGANFNSLYKELDVAQKRMNNFKSGMSSTMKKIGVVLGSLAVGKLVKDSTQMAMGVESAVDNINHTMQNSAGIFQKWAETQSNAFGMAKSEAYQYGSVYSNLLSVFTEGAQDNAEQTQKLLEATAVIASKTGRSYDDTANRIRSGMLGSTEAIEDLGIYTQVSMLESTNAFREFAGDSSWAQLDFQTQQQIRLAAILEQSYARYGDTLADTAQTRHAMFVASLRNIQLSLGQAFLPIYNAVLPALTTMANAIGTVINYIAQFVTAIFGSANKISKPFTQQAKAIGGAVGGMNDLGKATSGAGKAAKKAGKDAKKAGKDAKGALAGFDEINTLSMPSASDTGASSDAGGGAGGIGDGGGGIGGMEMPELGMGGFADSTLEVSERIQAMADKIKKILNDLKAFFEEHKTSIISTVAGLAAAIGTYFLITNWPAIVGVVKVAMGAISAAIAGISAPALAIAAVVGLVVAALVNLWQTNAEFRDKVTNAWKGIVDTAKNYWDTILEPIIKAVKDELIRIWNDSIKPLWKHWENFVAEIVYLMVDLWNGMKPVYNWIIDNFGPVIVDVFKFLVESIGSAISTIIDIVGSILKAFTGVIKGVREIFSGLIDFVVGVFTGDWKRAWNGVKTIFSGVRTLISSVWTGIKAIFNSILSFVTNTFKAGWTTAWNVVESIFGGAWQNIKNIFSISNIRRHFNSAVTTIKSVFSSIPNWFGSIFTTAWTNVKNVFSTGGKIFTGIKDGIASTFKTIVNGLIGGINRIIRVPFDAINGTLNKIRNTSIMGVKPFSGLISHNAISTPQIPRLAKGGITNGEMLAVVGDNPGGREVVSPLDTLQSMLVEAVGTAMSSNNSGNNQGDINVEIVSKIGESEFGRASVKAINKLTRQTGRTVLEI